ncbi:hypothetical protein [Paraurantiacibacter namhicola]|uniref:Uncharacterized protein n=1 Tax=Paraurantiacibacter namhicola TaxID=645517 RepID=A0A1C7D745_9SPHN|nr:hypothetical protein [Paraurantiacibacter namhicola]ANU07275.1 hypothetical protein A6F65_00965 [Paraurantiacibacter namhicola]
MKTRFILAAAIPLGLVAGVAGGRLADPAMQDRSVNPYSQTQAASMRLQERPRQARFAVQPQDLDPRGGYRPDLDYDSEVWDSDVARMEAERRGFHIDDYYASTAPLPAREQVEVEDTSTLAEPAANTPAPAKEQPQVTVTSGNDPSRGEPVTTDGIRAIY